VTGVLVIGETLLDRDVSGRVDRLAPDGPAPVLDVEHVVQRPGGAGLSALLLADRADRVRLATALGPADEDATRIVLGLLARHGVAVLELARTPGTRTLTRLRCDGRSLLRADQGSSEPMSAAVRLDPAGLESLEQALAEADVVLVSDYGAGMIGHPVILDTLGRWALRRPVVWDPHPRGPRPVPGSVVVTPNRREALHFLARGGRAGSPPSPSAPWTPSIPPLDVAAARLRELWGVRSVAATDGGRGVFTALADSPPLFTPTPFTAPGDPCGAGDRFAGTVALRLARGAVITEAIAAAVADTAAWLASGGVGTSTIHDDRHSSIPGHAAAWAAGSTVVATGGCFDVVHAGHVASLRAARALGDHLVVLVNDDASVRRLKGPGRPVHTVADRVAVLSCLECVDEVVVFSEDVPDGALRRLRPDIWAKGADYAAATLPEAEVLADWGGRVVLLPYLEGHSTTRILDHGTRLALRGTGHDKRS